MDGAEQPRTRRKTRFAPKARPSRKPKLAVPKTGEDGEDREGAQAQYLLGRFTFDPAAPVRVAFGPGAKTGPPIRTFGALRDKNERGIHEPELRSSAAYDEQMNERGILSVMFMQDYHHSNYPITLPLRRPFSGDPELLNDADFGEAARSLEYDEKTLNPASELGLLLEQDERKMILFRFPPKGLPLVKQPSSSKEKENIENVPSLSSSGASRNCKQLEDLSEGYMGKMLVYKSGAVKLKLGETLYDVTPSECTLAQDVVAITTKEKQCCSLGELGKVAHIHPDLDSILDSVINLS